MSGTELLLFAKGPAFAVALVVFALGIVLRLIEVLALGRKTDLAVPRGTTLGPGLRNVFRRFLPVPGMFRRSLVLHIGGMIFHIGFFVVVLLFVPHILLIAKLTGLSWPGLSNNIIDGVTLITLVAMIAVLVARFADPVRKMLTDFEDVLTWIVTFLPLLTGYLTVNRMVFAYETNLALHILSVEVLMVVFPFTKLMHAITWLFARFYTGAIAGRKGAHS